LAPLDFFFLALPPQSTVYGLLQSEELKFSPSRHIPFKPDGTGQMPTKTLGFWPRS